LLDILESLLVARAVFLKKAVKQINVGIKCNVTGEIAVISSGCLNTNAIPQ
jgi:hypothetical protein